MRRVFWARPGKGSGFVGNGFSGFFAGASAGNSSIEDRLVRFERDVVVVVEGPDRELSLPFGCTADNSAGKWTADQGFICFEWDAVVAVEGPDRELPFPVGCTAGLSAP